MTQVEVLQKGKWEKINFKMNLLKHGCICCQSQDSLSYLLHSCSVWIVNVWYAIG